MAEFDPTKPFESATDVSVDPADEGTLQELGEGILSGGIGALQGVAELIASGIDLMADTNLSENPKRKADKIREALGLDPTGFVGKGSEIITQFVVPGLGAAGLVSKGTKLGKLARSGAELTRQQKFALGAEQVAAAVGADIMVATDGVTTIGDFFEGGPTQTDKETGLQGREEALRKLGNKLRIGTETGLITAAAPTVLGATLAGVGKAADVVATPLAPVVGAGVRQLKDSRLVQGTKEALDEIEDARIFRPDELGTFKSVLSDTLNILRPRGYLPQEVAEQRSLISGIADAEIKKASNTLNLLNSKIDELTTNNTEFTRKQILDNLEAYLDPLAKGKTVEKGRKEALDNLPVEIQPIVVSMRNQVDSLSKEILDSDFIARLRGTINQKGVNIGDQLAATIEKNLNSYLRRRYLAKTDPLYKPDDETMAVAVQGFKDNPQDTLRVLKEILESPGSKETTKTLGLSDDGTRLVNNTISDSQAKKAADQFLARHRPKNRKPKTVFTRTPMEQIRGGMFMDRAKMPEYQRRLLGEIRDPEEAFLSTISDLAEFKAVDQYFGKIRELAENNEGIGRYFVKPDKITGELPLNYQLLQSTDEDILKGIEGQKTMRGVSEKLGQLKYGSLEGYAVPDEVYKQMTRLIVEPEGAFARGLMATYSGLLRAKGFTQYGKTVLSPITQIRNVTSASLFAAAQGNVGKGANVWESVRLVLNDIKKLTPEAQLRELQELQSLGVIGSQAELKEIRALINEGLAVGAKNVEDGVSVGRSFGEKIAQSKGGEFLASAGKKIVGGAKRMEDLYQGGDNIWKIYNYKFEQSKLRNALNGMSPQARKAYAQSKGFDNVDDFIKNESAQIVRNTVPNYNLAPEAIRGLRRLPVGNFIAFPYEILRTGANTIARGIDELASEVPEIQKIGLRRLTGAGTTFALFPAALAELAYTLSGVSEEEMKAYQRSIAPPWEKNARLIPTGRDKNGLPTYINYSYTNPYDMLERAVNGALNKVDEGKTLGKSGSQIAGEAMWESFSETFSPFVEESIFFAKLRDVLPGQAFGRDGRTVTGARVYNPSEALGDKVAKGFVHVLDALIPAGVPVDVTGGEFTPSRFSRAFISATGLNELTGVSPQDRQERERQITGEIIRGLTGITENEINPKLALKFKGYEFSEARKNASNIFNRVARRPNLTSSDELLNEYVRANEARFNQFNKFHLVVEDMKKLGVEEGEIKKILKQAGVTGVDKLIRGQYEPLEISKTVRREMKRNGTYDLLPRQQIQEIYQEQRKRKFGEPEEPVIAPPTQQAPAFDPTQPFEVEQAPQTTVPSQPRNEVSSILVPNPATRATFGIG